MRLGTGERFDGAANGTRATQRASPSTHGALALVASHAVEVPPAPLREGVVSTGFPVLDAALGAGGLPREASATFRGDASSGKTTLALRYVAEAQAAGAIVAFLDLGHSLDPLEAVARGVDLRWLIVLRPRDPMEGFALAGALLAGRSVDMLVIDLPLHLGGSHDALLRRLTAHARRVAARLLVLEPASLAGSVHATLGEVSSVRLELARRAWLRLGRDVVGQQTAVTVAKNRFGPPGREVELEIRYAEEGDRGGGVARLLAHAPPSDLPRLRPALSSASRR